MKTRTGGFPIGFRRGGGWQEELAPLARWAGEAGFELIDLAQASEADVATVKEAGLNVVSADLHDWSGLLSPDRGKRTDVVSRNSEYIQRLAGVGVRVFFTVAIPEDPTRSGRDNFDLAIASFGELAAVAEGVNAMVVLEGWPGSPPYPNLFCNPETCRALFQEVPSRGVGINFDPSHLIRMGIDHERFVDEFADRIGHVHGKDTELMADHMYEVGWYQPSIFKKPPFCGEYVWRYTIPGHGVTRWSFVWSKLEAAGYAGAVSVELEDADYNGSEAGEKAGLIESLRFLANT
jgi:sugar phosphate isomerase/epimerase